MEAKDQRQQPIVHSLIVYVQILRSVILEVGEGFEDDCIVEMLAGIQSHCLIGFLVLKIPNESHLPSVDLKVNAELH